MFRCSAGAAPSCSADMLVGEAKWSRDGVSESKEDRRLESDVGR